MSKRTIQPTASNRLREAIRASGLSLNEIGRRSGVDQSRLSRFMRAERDLTFAAVEKIFIVMGLHVSPLLSAAGETKNSGKTRRAKGGK